VGFIYTKGNEAMARKELRRVKLTDDQYVRLSTVIQLHEDGIVDLVYRLVERAQYQAAKGWNEIRRIAESDGTEIVSLNHISRELVVYQDDSTDEKVADDCRG
jgi:hypothetical protein